MARLGHQRTRALATANSRLSIMPSSASTPSSPSLTRNSAATCRHGELSVFKNTCVASVTALPASIAPSDSRLHRTTPGESSLPRANKGARKRRSGYVASAAAAAALVIELGSDRPATSRSGVQASGSGSPHGVSTSIPSTSRGGNPARKARATAAWGSTPRVHSSRPASTPSRGSNAPSACSRCSIPSGSSSGSNSRNAGAAQRQQVSDRKLKAPRR